VSEQSVAAQGKLLVVDDDQDMLNLLSTWLGSSGYSVSTALCGTDALAQIEISKPDLVITDLFMDEMNGMDLLTRIHGKNPLIPVIMLSGQAQIPDAVKATHLGTAAFLTKPIEKVELLAQVSRHARIRSEVDAEKTFGQSLIHRSSVMSELLEQGEMLAAGDITVFIHGETGTGKEVLAKAIHDASPRTLERFIGVNCGAIPEQLLESELFGHEKGAFTGANTSHDGLFKAADGGTLFLDEIGDMPLGLQVKLLRVLQDFEIRPVGSTASLPVNVRIISATHNDLDELVERGEFREDLYYRLNVVPLSMPSLRERREDIAPLLEHFLEKHALRTKTNVRRFGADASEYLVSAPWPGNVRQLANAVEFCATLSKSGVISLEMAQKALRDEPGQIQTLKQAKQDFERKYLISVLRVTSGNVSHST
jgi:two-component system response regulator GlrR